MTETYEMKAKFNYRKNLQARYIAHLDTIDIICKALRRSDISYAVTQGCHVRPKITFGPPLPLGHVSHCEYFILTLTTTPNLQDLQKKLTEQLPLGMKILDIEYPWIEKKASQMGEHVNYNLWFKTDKSAQKAISFLQNSDADFEVISKGRPRKYKLGKAVQSLELEKDKSDIFIRAEFIQGIADVPSVSKIVTALSVFLGDFRDDLSLIERTALKAL